MLDPDPAKRLTVQQVLGEVLVSATNLTLTTWKTFLVSVNTWMTFFVDN